MIDIIGRSANGQMGIRKDALDVTNARKFEQGADYKFNSNELKRVFNFVIKSKQNVWKKKSKVGRKVLEFDYNNKIFRNIVNQELKRWDTK